MRRSVDIGIWRSPRVEEDWWPQSTHLVWEPEPLVVCAAGGGGGSQQAMFREDLDPLLAAALERWHARPDEGWGPKDVVDEFFDEVQRGFMLLDGAHARELQASAIALTIDGERAAFGHVGLERGWRWRDGTIVQITKDHTLGLYSTPAVQEWVNRLPASWFGQTCEHARWRVVETDVREGDIFVLAAGGSDTGFVLDHLAPKHAQGLADELGELAWEFATEDHQRWRVGSRLSIAVVAV